jgi:hypothetical protein
MPPHPPPHTPSHLQEVQRCGVLLRHAPQRLAGQAQHAAGAPPAGAARAAGGGCGGAGAGEVEVHCPRHAPRTKLKHARPAALRPAAAVHPLLLLPLLLLLLLPLLLPLLLLEQGGCRRLPLLHRHPPLLHNEQRIGGVAPLPQALPRAQAQRVGVALDGGGGPRAALPRHGGGGRGGAGGGGGGGGGGPKGPGVDAWQAGRDSTCRSSAACCRRREPALQQPALPSHCLCLRCSCGDSCG